MVSKGLAVVCIFGVCFLAAICFAQNPEGTLVGSVRDSTGARIIGAAVTAKSLQTDLQRSAHSNSRGEFQFVSLPPGRYRVEVAATHFANFVSEVEVDVGSSPTLSVELKPEGAAQSITVRDESSLSSQPMETTSSIEKTTISAKDLQSLPLANRSFANIAYLSPMTAPVEPSDPTKARITAVSFAGSSGLNVDLSVDGGDNNDDYIGGFLQNYSPDAMEEFTVRTAQFDADTSRTNGGSVIITTKRGADQWHGSLAGYFRERAFNARNRLDNPEPAPKQPFSRQDAVGSIGGPIMRGQLWFFSSLEYIHENASIAYSTNSLAEFNALAGLAALGQIPGVNAIAVPSFTAVPFRDTLFSNRVDWAQSQRSQWFFRGSFDLNKTKNDLVQQATLPSTGATTTSDYYSFLINHQFTWTPTILGSFTFQASGFHHVKDRNSHLGLALAFPFSATFHTTSGFETFGDNQFVTPITAFPVRREQQKYQFRYDLSHLAAAHSLKFGINFIHEPVLGGRLALDPETLVKFPKDPNFYLNNLAQFNTDFTNPANNTVTPAGVPAVFAQNVQRLGVYAQDSWRVLPSFTINYGLRYDTTFGLFRAEGRSQALNPALPALRAAGVPFAFGTPHDYHGAIAPRLGFAYSPGVAGRTVIRAGAGMYYNDLAQNGWVDALRAVGTPSASQLPVALGPADQGAVIDPRYHTPYALQASAGMERVLTENWRLNIFYEHQQGVHQYRRYEYVSGVTLPATVPSVSLFKTDNRSQYDGISFEAQHRFSHRFELTAHYTLAHATTWGATVGELFDYVNGVSDVRNPFGPGDHGPSGEDVRHRFVLAGALQLPWKFEVSTLSQFESARPYTLATSATDPAGNPVDLNQDGVLTNDRAIVNGVQTSLDQFRGTPFAQVDLRVAREFHWGERISFRPFAEFFNLFNRSNPGNNFVGDVAALPLPVNSTINATALCLDAACTQIKPIRSLNDLRVPAGALGDFFGPGTTVGIPFAAQLGLRVSF